MIGAETKKNRIGHAIDTQLQVLQRNLDHFRDAKKMIKIGKEEVRTNTLEGH